MDERVVVVARQALIGRPGQPMPQGLITDATQLLQLRTAIDTQWGVQRRGLAEQDPRCKQIIPYVVLWRPATSPDAPVAQAPPTGLNAAPVAPAGELSGGEVFAYRRLSGGGETRLAGLRSVGVGGHMNDSGDRPFAALLRANLERELREEVHLTPVLSLLPDPEPLGFINDDAAPVGEVHLGLLCLLRCSAGTEAVVREPDKLVGDWQPLATLQAEVAASPQEFETWSQYALAALS